MICVRTHSKSERNDTTPLDNTALALSTNQSCDVMAERGVEEREVDESVI
jgi:hypothetical protein